MAGIKHRALDLVSRARARSRLVDRLVRSASAYKAAGGDRRAAALTYYGFLAVFPTILLAVSVLGFVLRSGSELRTTILSAAEGIIPGGGSLLINSLDAITEKASTIGIIGLAGVLWAGLGFVSSLREALDAMFGVDVRGGVRGKLRDLRFVGLVGFILFASISMSTVVVGGSYFLENSLGVPRLAVQILGIGLTFMSDVGLFVVLFAYLPDHSYGARDVFAGAVLSAWGSTILKTAGGTILSASASRSSAAYGIGAATFGLLLSINLTSRLTLFAASFAAIDLEPVSCLA